MPFNTTSVRPNVGMSWQVVPTRRNDQSVPLRDQIGALCNATVRIFPDRTAFTLRQHADYYERVLLVVLARGQQLRSTGQSLADALTDMRACFSDGCETRRRFYYLGNGQRVFDDLRKTAEVLAGYHGNRVPDWLTHVELTVRLKSVEQMLAFCDVFNATAALVIPPTPADGALRWPYARPASAVADSVSFLSAGVQTWSELLYTAYNSGHH